tara:strand:- start:25 stop:336 length:312 start_codon:yes stop_codon:yes gene_type:complete
MKKLKYILPILFFISACGGLSDAKKALKNEKVITTDEFLVKKKEPLVLPPEFDKLPAPDSKKNPASKSKEKDKLKKILKADEKVPQNKKSSSSLEETIIDKIR